jgi:hypothetical protein
MTMKIKAFEADSPSEYRTPDLYYAAYLMASGVPLIRCEKDMGRMFWFFGSSAKGYEMAWMNDSGTVKPRSFAEAIKTLKNMVHAQ